jgi:hypothetical protein
VIIDVINLHKKTDTVCKKRAEIMMHRLGEHHAPKCLKVAHALGHLFVVDVDEGIVHPVPA